jgi:TRAP-type C4-dicarboxylate transport system permease small subunit
MMLATVAKVALRVVANHGILGIDQLSGTMMVYITFLGAAWVLRNDGHVTVDIFIDTLPARVRRMVQVVGSLVGAAACLSIAWFATHAVIVSIQRGVLIAAEIEMPRAVNLVVIPLGCFLLGIEFVRRALRFHRGEMEPHAMPRMEA